MTTNAFPELIFKTVQAEARNGRNLSLLTHAIGLNRGWWFVTQKWHLDAPLPRSRVLQHGGGSIHSSRFVEQKMLHKTWGAWDIFKAIRITKETVSSIIIFC